MAELKKEEVKKELEGMVEKEKAKIQASIEANLTAEEKKALEEKKTTEAKKAEEARIAAEAQAKKDAELLLKKDEEIADEAEKKRKAELLEKQQKDEDKSLSAEEKIKRIEEKTQKRIDELSNKLKEVTDKSSKEAQVMRNEVETLRKEKAERNKPPEDILSLVEKEEAEKQKKYLEDDKSLSREKRREMPDDEIEEWLLEDQKSAIAWINRREIRREGEKRQNFTLKKREEMSKQLFTKQAQSYARTMIKHPELDVVKRKNELKSQGKSEDEADSIVRTENKEYDTFVKILEDNPDFKLDPNAPEKMAEEMEKILKKKETSGEEKNEIEKLREQVESLSAELARISSQDEGINSNLLREKKGREEITEAENMLVETMRSHKATQAMIDEAVKKFREKRGAK